ncbi:MAG: TolC family protein [Candidatus Omnitrophica bacterium]|nr:TolC family protein [Candidatus Omnitrophota bacterium]
MIRMRWGVPLMMAAMALAARLPTPPAWADSARDTATVEAQRVTLDALIDQVLRQSPGLQAKRHAYEAARKRVIAAWLPDDPMFGVDVEGQPDLFEFSGRANNEYMVAQTIPFPTTLLLRGRIASRDAQMAYQRYKEAERDVVWHLEQPYYKAYLAKKTLAVLQEVRILLDKLASAVQGRYETSKSSQQDLLKAQIERAKVDIEIAAAQAEEHTAEAHISHLLNRSLEARYDLAEDVDLSLLNSSRPELDRMAVARRPELKVFELGIKRAKTSRLLAMTNWLPDLTGRIESRQFKGESGIREHDTFLGVTVPVWSLLKGASGEWASANHDVKEAEAQYEEMKNEVLLAVHEAHSTVQAADYAVRMYELSILPQAKQQVEVALAGYEAGRSDFLELIDAQRMLRDVQLAYYKAKADHELGMSNLRLAIGGPTP